MTSTLQNHVSSRAKTTSWPFERCYRMLGYTFRVRSDQPDLGALVDQLLSRFRAGHGNGVPAYTVVGGGRGPAPFRVYHRGRCVQRGNSASKVLDYVLWHANSEAVKGERAFIALHAAAASWNGEGILLPAPPDSGKTTTVAGLTRSGFSYLTDEAALIDPRTGRLHPYPRPLWMSKWSVDAIPRLRQQLPARSTGFMDSHYHIKPDDLRRGSIGSPCRVRYIIAPHYVGGNETLLKPMSRGEALLLLAENSFNFERFGSGGLRVLRDVVAGADCYRLRIGDLLSAVEAVRDVVGSEGTRDNEASVQENTADVARPAFAGSVPLALAPADRRIV